MHAWPFEGRAAELSLIKSAFLRSDVDAVVLMAPAGAGKTRLARQALASLDGVRTAWVGATRAAAGIPFSAVAPLLPDEAIPGGSLELIRAAATYVLGWGGRHRVAVGVDDAQLLDDASSTLIAHLIINRVAFVILTVRAGEPVADVLLRLSKEGVAQRVELPPLPEEIIDKLIDHAVSERLDTRGRRRLHETAQGNPLALRELLYGAVPGGLTDLISSRLDGLEPGTRAAVELVACGEPLAVSILERLVGLAPLAAAEDSGLIVVERSGARMHARLDHPLYGEVLRSRLPLSRAVQVYRDLAGALLETPLRRREDLLRAALWQIEGRLTGRPDVLRSGAWQAVGHADLDLAERLARAARVAEPGVEVDRLLAEILAYRGRTKEAAQVLPATPPPEPADRVAWAVTSAETLYWGAGDADSAHKMLDTTAGNQVTEASRSWLLFFDARCSDAARTARRVLNDPDADSKSLIWAAAAGTAAAGFLGHLDDAVNIHSHGAAVAAAHMDAVPWGVFEVDTGACLAHLACGQPAAAYSIAMAGYRTALGGGAAMMVSGWALYGGLAAAARGHLDEADRLLAEALTGFESNDTFRLARCCLAARAGVAALRGDPDADTLMARADTLDHPSNKVFGPWLETWRAWTAYASGDLPAAVAAATHAADLARHAAMPAVEALALYDLARLGARPGLARFDAIDHDLAELLGGAARALASSDSAAALEAAARALQARGFDLHAAEAYAAAAHRHRRHGRTAQADLAGAIVAQLHAALPGTRTPLLQPVHFASLLTPREREVLLLAAVHTSAEIAARLHLAVPTVNNNLARAYTKLGITGRAQLRTLLGDDPTKVI